MLQINLVRLIIYSVYEKCLCQLVKYPQSKFVEFSFKSIGKSKKIQFEDTVDIEKIINKITEENDKSNFYYDTIITKWI